MWLRLAACAAFLVVPVAYAQMGTTPSSTLSLDDAIARVATTHPDLRIFDGRRQVLDANLASAALKPPMTLGATIENTLGTGNYRGFSEAELTVTLAGVIERGGKLNARQALALANIDTLAPQREMARLDLLAETAQRYLAVTAATKRKSIAELDIVQRRRAVDAARTRLTAGASPESVVLTAQAALATAELDRDRAIADEAATRQNLAALWNERTPSFTVAAIRGAGELLQDELPPADRQLFAQQVVDQSLRLQNLIDQLMQLSQLEQRPALAQAHNGVAATTSLRQCAEQALRQLQTTAAQKGLALQLQGDDSSGAWDARLVELAISNLLANALDFSPAGSQVLVQLGPNRVTVQDSGPGVPDALMHKLGERFFTTPRPNGERSGTGLGLSIVHRIMQLHGGQLHFANTQPGLRVELDFAPHG